MSDIEFDLTGRFMRLEWLLRRWQAQNRRAHGPMSDPHRGQGRILALLKLRPEISQRELSYLLDISPQSLGELLAKLEKSGYITREPSEADRRVMIVRLTEEGRKAAEQQTEQEDLFSILTPEEQDALSGYLDKIIESLEKRCGCGEDKTKDGRGWRADWGPGSFSVRPGMVGKFGRAFGMKGEGGPFGKGMEFWFGGGGGPAPFEDGDGEETDAPDGNPGDGGFEPQPED